MSLAEKYALEPTWQEPCLVCGGIVEKGSSERQESGGLRAGGAMTMTKNELAEIEADLAAHGWVTEAQSRALLSALAERDAELERLREATHREAVAQIGRNAGDDAYFAALEEKHEAARKVCEAADAWELDEDEDHLETTEPLTVASERERYRAALERIRELYAHTSMAGSIAAEALEEVPGG